MALRVEQQALPTRHRDADGPACPHREERGVALHGEVLLRPERTTVADLRDQDTVLGNPEEQRDLLAVVPHPLSLREHLEGSVLVRHGQR
jgi:hypothetical protein